MRLARAVRGRFGAMGFIASIAVGASPAAASDRQIPMADYIQQVWDARDGGLPHPTVTALLQTRDGYLWIGTYSGLARFDGLSFHRPAVDAHAVYRDHVRALVEAPDGSLWVGTRRTGLVRIKDGAIQALTTKDGLAGNDVLSVAATGDGTVWMVAGEQLAACDPGGRVRRYGADDGLPLTPLTTVFADEDGTVWVGGRHGGLAWHDGRTFHVVRRWAEGGDALQVSAITRAQGALWVGTTTGLFQLEGERSASVSARRRFPDSIASFSADEGGLWVGTATSGIVRFEGAHERRYGPDEGLLHEWVLALRQDAQKNLWVGTRTGLVQLRSRIIQNYTRRDGLPGVHAICVLEGRDGDLWVGTSSGLARRHDGRWTTLGVDDGLPQGTVKGLAEGADGTIWIGTNDGIARFKNGRLTATVPAGRGYSVRAMATDARGTLWLGPTQGLDRLDDGVPTPIVPRERLYKGSATNVVFPASDGSVWIGADNALMRVRDGNVESFVDSTNRLRNDVRYISEDADGVLWIGSIGGLSRVRKGKVEALPGPRAPFNTGNYAVVDDARGSLWISTNKGLFQVRKDDLARDGGQAAARAFGTADGLATSVMTASGGPTGWRGRDGRLYFTSLNGIEVVDPERATKLSSAALPVYIVDLVADGRALAPRGTPRLAPGTREVEIHFAAVDFVSPELVRYRYRLEGLDAEWRRSTSGRVAQYTNLRPGTYRFQVLATDHTGLWHEPGAVLTFELAPRFYQTLSFRALAVLALAGIVFAAHRLRLAAARARAAELQHRVEEAVTSLQVLQGLLPICTRCRRVREDSGYWQQLEVYVMERSDARFSHSICADCYDKLKLEEPDLPPEIGRQ